MRQLRIAFAFALASALLCDRGVARADDAASTDLVLPTPIPTAPSERWYGYQTLLLDVVPLVAVPVGGVLAAEEGRADGNPIVGVSVLGVGASAYLLGGPIVHWAHGRVGVGFLSLGLRVLGPLAGLGLGAVTSEIATGSKNQDGIPVGAALGALAAIVFDGAVLGWQKVPDERAPARATKAPAMSFAPSVVVTKQALSLGVASSF